MLRSNSDIVKEFKETYLWVKRAEKLLNQSSFAVLL